jgi:hypothetical protein
MLLKQNNVSRHRVMSFRGLFAWIIQYESQVQIATEKMRLLLFPNSTAPFKMHATRRNFALADSAWRSFNSPRRSRAWSWPLHKKSTDITTECSEKDPQYTTLVLVSPANDRWRMQLTYTRPVCAAGSKVYLRSQLVVLLYESCEWDS